MKTLENNIEQQPSEKVRNERRKIINTTKSSAKLNEPIFPEFKLNKQDLQDIMDIKRRRADRVEKNSKLFFSMGLAFVLLVANIFFNWNFATDGAIDELTLLQNTEFDEMIEVPKTEQPPPPPPSVLKQPIIVEVPNEEILEEVNIDLDVEVTEEMAIEQVEFDEVIIEEEAEEIFQIVEFFPEPIGGYAAFYKFVNENIKYPTDALRMHIAGKVFVRFVVDKEGNVTNVEAVKGIGGGCDEEAVRILEKSPKWSPGKQRGRPVNVYMMLPITFMLK